MADATADGRIPRSPQDDYTADNAALRREFLHEKTGVALEHVAAHSFDPAMLRGNVEQFIGVAQVPIGIAGPLVVDGEHAQGAFYVPLATAEGTLVASYNRGMRLLREAGGVKTTVLDDAMQRAPAFVFPSAREARGSSATSSSTPQAASCSRASTTRPATQRARTSPARRPPPRACGSTASRGGASGAVRAAGRTAPVRRRVGLPVASNSASDRPHCT